jgi:hypothetical protein
MGKWLRKERGKCKGFGTPDKDIKLGAIKLGARQ